VAPSADSPTRAPENQENHPDNRQDETDGLQDRDVSDETHEEKNDTENYHFLFLTVGVVVAYHRGLIATRGELADGQRYAK